MRVIDLLALLADQNKNASVLLDTQPTPSRFDDFILTTADDQPQLIFKPNLTRKAPLRVWELQLLLNKPDLQARFLYLTDANGPRALLGSSSARTIYYLTRLGAWLRLIPQPPFLNSDGWQSFLHS